MIRKNLIKESKLFLLSRVIENKRSELMWRLKKKVKWYLKKNEPRNTDDLGLSQSKYIHAKTLNASIYKNSLRLHIARKEFLRDMKKNRFHHARKAMKAIRRIRKSSKRASGKSFFLFYFFSILYRIATSKKKGKFR